MAILRRTPGVLFINGLINRTPVSLRHFMNTNLFFIHIIMGLLNLYDVENSIVVIIDVFRATSTIATALYNGATKVVPVTSVELHKHWQKNERHNGRRKRWKNYSGLQHGNSQPVSGNLLTTKNACVNNKPTEPSCFTWRWKWRIQVVTGSFQPFSHLCAFKTKTNKNVQVCSAWKKLVLTSKNTLFAWVR